MASKQKVVDAVQALPEDASYEDANERLVFLAKIERGLEQARRAQTISNDEMRDRTEPGIAVSGPKSPIANRYSAVHIHP